MGPPTLQRPKTIWCSVSGWRTDCVRPAPGAVVLSTARLGIAGAEGGIAVDLRNEGLGLVLRDMLLPAKEEAFA